MIWPLPAESAPKSVRPTMVVPSLRQRWIVDCVPVNGVAPSHVETMMSELDFSMSIALPVDRQRNWAPPVLAIVNVESVTTGEIFGKASASAAA
jgi:hypothetical protein